MGPLNNQHTGDWRNGKKWKAVTWSVRQVLGAETALRAETSGEEREAGVKRGGRGGTTGAEGCAHPGVEREHPAVEREHPGVERELPGVEREHPAVEREHPGVEREHPGVERELPLLEICREKGDVGPTATPKDAAAWRSPPPR